MTFAPRLTLVPLLALTLPAAAQSDCGSLPGTEIVGPGTVGVDGEPQLDVFGWPAIGGRFGLRVTDAAPSAPGLLVANTTLAPLTWPEFGATSYPLLPGLVETFFTDADGRSEVLLEFDPVPPVLCGFEAFGQAIVIDAAAQGGVAFTPGRRVRFGIEPTPPLPQRRLAENTRAMVWLDVDDDGRIDLVTSRYDTPQGVEYRRNLGGGDFAEPEAWTIDGNSLQLAQGDLDGDGDEDVVALETSSGQPLTLMAVGGALTAPVASPAAGVPAIDLGLIDFDRDGRLDLAFVEPFGDLYIARGLGDGTFEAASPTSTGPNLRDLAIGDTDGDGDDELVTASPNQLLVLDDAQAATLQVVQSLSSSVNSDRVAIGDLDHDGISDLVRLSEQHWELFTGTASGTFEAATALPIDGALPFGLRVLDLDENGDSELVVAGRSFSDKRELSVFTYGDKGLERDGTYGVHELGRDFAWIDADSDGARELALRRNEDLTLLESDGAIGFFSGYPGNGSLSDPLDAAVGDLNDDGIDDMVQVYGISLPVLASYLGDGQSNFSSTYAANAPSPPARVALEDVDLDGHLDGILLVTSPFLDAIAVLAGLGDGSFAPHVGFGTVKFPRTLDTGDFDEDGRVDLALLSFDQPSDVSVQFGGAAPLFSPPTSVPLPAGPLGFASRDLEVLDVDLDGHLDLIAVGPLSTAVLLGDGQGQFTQGTTLDFGGSLLEAVDLDLDGDSDVVVGTGAGLVPLENLGDGTFTVHPAQTIPGGRLVAADVTGDAHPELLTSAGTPTYYVRLISTGGGFELTDLGVYATGGGPLEGSLEQIVTADVDLDGDQDVVVLGGRTTILPSGD